MANLSVKDSTVNFIASLEGFEEVAFWDVKQYSIGFGTGTMPNGQPVKKGDRVTRAQAVQMLARDAVKFGNYVNQYITSSLSQNQWDALTSFVYNLGPGALSGTGVQRAVNENPNDFESVKKEMMRWVNAGGKFNQGVYNRRVKEVNMYANGSVQGSNFFF
jgi:lysozyme